MDVDTQKTRRLVAVFLFGLMLYTYPILSLFNLDKMIFGIPVLYFCLFAIWAFLILLIIIMTRLHVNRAECELEESAAVDHPDAPDDENQREAWETKC